MQPFVFCFYFSNCNRRHSFIPYFFLLFRVAFMVSFNFLLVKILDGSKKIKKKVLTFGLKNYELSLKKSFRYPLENLKRKNT